MVIVIVLGKVIVIIAEVEGSPESKHPKNLAKRSARKDRIKVDS